MKITKNALKRMIKEELSKVLNESQLDDVLKSWATHRAKADGGSYRPGSYDINGGKAVFSNTDGYLYYGSARDSKWGEVKKLASAALTVSQINVNPPNDAESLNSPAPSRGRNIDPLDGRVGYFEGAGDGSSVPGQPQSS